ncbi:hypothetical protein WH47_00836 [Habropoda laboriosa]|uniref:Uncharacterized protein n=1 Tax=Habropoda laboriosa TaxID=597456 RepID=A0A0L7R844_9HYME|nr:hypothetical protein WH47_00836 [Habropoda laboriosa]
MVKKRQQCKKKEEEEKNDLNQRTLEIPTEERGIAAPPSECKPPKESSTLQHVRQSSKTPPERVARLATMSQSSEISASSPPANFPARDRAGGAQCCKASHGSVKPPSARHECLESVLKPNLAQLPAGLCYASYPKLLVELITGGPANGEYEGRPIRDNRNNQPESIKIDLFPNSQQDGMKIYLFMIMSAGEYEDRPIHNNRNNQQESIKIDLFSNSQQDGEYEDSPVRNNQQDSMKIDLFIIVSKIDVQHGGPVRNSQQDKRVRNSQQSAGECEANSFFIIVSKMVKLDLFIIVSMIDLYAIVSKIDVFVIVNSQQESIKLIVSS